MMPSSQRPRCRRRRPITKNRQTNSHEQTSCSPPEPEHSTRRRRRRSSFAILVIAQTALLAVSSMVVPFLLPAGVSAHGYLKTPRSRNLVAYQDKNYEEPDVNDPKPEDCPHCLNRGGKRAQCGILYGDQEGIPWERNYDNPLNILGEPMQPNLQGVYRAGGTIEVEVLVTTHHKGHFEFAACPIDATQVPMVTATEECFKANKLVFISDESYGAPPDPNYPERAYIAPASKVDYVEPLEGVQPVVGAYYKMKFQLPEGLAGNLVLLQWYYLTANSCKHEGYADYDFPEEWGSDVSLYPGLPDCGEVPPDGNGVPEQFWNCAEIRIVGTGGGMAPLTSPVVASSEDDTMISMGASAGDTPAPTPPPVTPSPTDEVLYYPFHAGQLCKNDGEQPDWLESKDIFTSLDDCCNTHFAWKLDTCIMNSPDERPGGGGGPSKNSAAALAPGEKAFKVCTKNAASAYYEATNDCTGYYLCMNGQQGEILECAGFDMLYDESTEMCNWKSEVSCKGLEEEESPFDEFGNPRPTKSPTQSPTGKPNELLAWNPGEVDRGHSKTMIGYYASWQWYDRMGIAEPKNFDWSKITRANFAFFQITPEGDIFGTDPWADPITLFGFYDWTSEEGTVHTYCSWDEPGAAPNCMAHNYQEGLIYLAHQAGAEVYPSIGGWSLSDPFPVMAASETGRARFASQCIDLIKNYNFDGIDLDWEYPGYEPHSGTPDDTINFNLLLDDVRAALDEFGAETGRFYGLTAALPCGPSIIDNQDIEHVGRLLTELNLMTYDFHGAWNEKSGVNAPLYDQEDSPDFSVHGCVNNWLKGGAPREKINIGFPFYGRSFLNVDHLYEVHDGNDDTTWHMDEGVPQYYNIMDKIDEYTSYRDEQTMTQVCYGTTGMVSYDDERAICDKTEYAQVHELNGYIIWEVSGDLMPDLSTPLLDAANAKLLNPNLDCASLDLSDVINDLIGDAFTVGDPESDVAGGAPEVVYYPDRAGNVCLHDGLHPDWLKPSEIFNNAEDCCDKHFSWIKSCLEDSPDTPPPSDLTGITPKTELVSELVVEFAYNAGQYYPSSTGYTCLSDGNQPSWLPAREMFDNEKDCCEHHFPGRDCVGKLDEEKPLLAMLYYPSSTGVDCLRDGNQPSWLGSEVMFDTKEECCESNYQRKQDCMTNGNDTLLTTMVAPQLDSGLVDVPEPQNYPALPLPVPPKAPTQNPTPRPSGRPTGHPSRQESKTKSPTPYPTPQPSRHPTETPTAQVFPNTPTPPYQMILNGANSVAAQTPRPTREPTMKPQKRPTPRPTRKNPVMEGSPIASSFLGRPASSFTIIPPSNPVIVEINNPSKGQEQLGESIKHQIQQQQNQQNMTTKNAKMLKNKRQNKKKQKKKKKKREQKKKQKNAQLKKQPL